MALAEPHDCRAGRRPSESGLCRKSRKNQNFIMVKPGVKINRWNLSVFLVKIMEYK
jgi:hypothetical protein